MHEIVDMLFVLIIIIKGVVACPEECSCSTSSSSIRHVHCWGLKYIPTDIPNNTVYLEIIWGQELTQVDELVFRKLVQLETLNLETNEISMIHKDAFSNLISLTELRLGRNKLTQINGEWFKNTTKLHTLELHHNDITTIHRDEFKYLISLTSLQLKRNMLTIVDDDVFHNLEHLEKLELDTNNIWIIHGDAFRDLILLQYLDLSYNKLTTIDNKLFQNLTNLKGLYLQYNNISVLPRDVFKDLISLENLYLNNNKISLIEYDAFGSLPALYYLGLFSNPLTCDCSIFYIFSWLTKRGPVETHIRSSCSNGSFVTDLNRSELEKCYDCTGGLYGLYCRQRCGKCYDKKQCHQIIGTCPNGCDEGYKGETCTEECNGGKYGSYCSQPCGKCHNQTQCHHITGTCPNGCGIGYQGKTCTKVCEETFYGEECLQNCSSDCENRICDPTTGSCLKILTTNGKSKQDYVGAVAGTIICLFLILATIFIVSWRRRLSKRNSGKSHELQRYEGVRLPAGTATYSNTEMEISYLHIYETLSARDTTNDQGNIYEI